MADSVIIQSKVRELVKKEKPDFRLSEEFLTSLNEKVELSIKVAVLRADLNGRKTLQPQDM